MIILNSSFDIFLLIIQVILKLKSNKILNAKYHFTTYKTFYDTHYV